jgi:hypothetical protein
MGCPFSRTVTSPGERLVMGRLFPSMATTVKATSLMRLRMRGTESPAKLMTAKKGSRNKNTDFFITLS